MTSLGQYRENTSGSREAAEEKANWLRDLLDQAANGDVALSGDRAE